MSTHTPPSFDEWVHYCFTHGNDDFRGESGDSKADVDERERRFLGIDPVLLAQHLTRLFESPGFIADRYTDAQIAGATWFFFGCASGYFSGMQRAEVPIEAHARCVRSVSKLYTDLYDRVCGRRGTDPDTDLRETVELDCAVYMIWDMSGFGGGAFFPNEYPHLVEPELDVLQAVLDECRTSACLISALHGIGHIYCFNNYKGNRAMARRIRSMIDRFLRERRSALPQWVREYAEDASDGGVQ